MKALTCEMCGSTNLIKQEGLFVCQNCNTKYSVEEAKKMMIEGPVTVQVDTSEEIKNLYQLARRAKEARSEDARKYYEMILLKEPDSWEAIFYSKLAKIYNVTNGQVEAVIYDIDSSLEMVLNLIKKLPENDKKAFISMVTLDVGTTAIAAFNGSFQELEETKNPEVFSMFFKNCVSAITLQENFADLLESSFPEDKNIYDICVEFWERSIGYRVRMAPYLDDKKPNQEFINQLSEKIKRSKAEYTAPETVKKGPCFIATAVYGSYDCPEVWTLRRYRDDVLAARWYGRLFIKSYYAISPVIVRLFGNTELFKKFWKNKLDDLVADLRKQGIKDTPYKDKSW